ncbi:MAG: hypothetical protein QME74_10120 [Candidatus Edwardsbacteria bacterium]|nr:hypothetical protein [Candidatus Edwardsbacteria bacterium]
MRKRAQSTADYQSTAQGLIKGGEINKAETTKWGLLSNELQKLLDRYTAADARQEKLKGELHQSTDDLTAVKMELSKEIARWVSVLEGQYGKRSEKLQDFSITPRMLKPHKGPRAKKG